MRRGLLASATALLAVVALLSGCALTGGGVVKRPTNVEVRILSQSSFNGDIVPCG